MFASSSAQIVAFHISTKLVTTMRWVDGSFLVPKVTRFVSKKVGWSLAKSSFLFLCFVFSHDGDGDDHDVCLANTAKAHTWWRHLVALHEPTDTLHRAMCLMSYLPGGMVVTINVDSVTFYYIVLDNSICAPQGARAYPWIYWVNIFRPCVRASVRLSPYR